MEKLLKSRRMKNHECRSTPPFSGVAKRTKVSINSKGNFSFEMERDTGLNPPLSLLCFSLVESKVRKLVELSAIFFFEFDFWGKGKEEFYMVTFC